MKILGIETSCDETAAAVVEDGQLVLSNVIASQAEIHAKTGGVVPEVASREHVIKIVPVIEEALKKAGVNLDEIDGIALTKGPGLVVCLLIGTNTASALALVKNKPLVPINHIEGHIYSNWLGGRNEAAPRSYSQRAINFPIVILTASGGHNELVLMKGHGDYEILGSTRDDAAGEAFDKVARILGLGYPGGPAISKVAPEGDASRYPLPRSWLSRNEAVPRSYSFDFSFSGLKTATLRLVQTESKCFKTSSQKNQFTKDVAASFQEAVCDVLSAKLISAAKKFSTKEIHLAGGVSANVRLRELITERMKKELDLSVQFRYPASFSYCTDNAAMIAAAGYFRYINNPKQYEKFRPVIAEAGLKLM